MPRIRGVRGREVGFTTRLVYSFARRDMEKTAGRSPERMLEPVEIYGWTPSLLRAYGRMEQATAEMGRMPQRYLALAAMKTATMVTCEYCIDLGSQISRQLGLTDEELLDLPLYESSPLFDDIDRVVLGYAVGMALRHESQTICSRSWLATSTSRRSWS